MDMKTFSAQEMVTFGWATFKSRWEFFVGATALWMLVSFAISVITDRFPEHASDGVLLWLVGIIISAVFSTLLNMGFIALSLKAHDAPREAEARMLWHPHPFWKYIGASILSFIVIVAGLVLLIVPGVIAALALAFTTMLVIDRELAPIEAMKESVRITKGNRLELLLLIVILFAINILGALALLVGLLVSVPVSYLAFAHAYRTLSAKTPAPAVAATA